MNICINCQLEINDMRKAVRCNICGASLHKECSIKEEDHFCDLCFMAGESGNDNEVEIPDVIRRSYIETYKSCPHRFYMEAVKGIQPPPNIYSQLGTDIHKLIETLCQHPSYLKSHMLFDFHQLWYEYDEALFENQEQKDKLYKRAIDSINNAYEIIPDMPAPFRTEESVQFPVGEGLPQVSAIIDRVDLSENELNIHDWKTGAMLVGQKLSSDLQAPLYIYGAQQQYGYPVRSFTYHYLQDGKQRIFERLYNDVFVCRVKKREYFINLTDVIREVQSIFSRIKKGDFNVPRQFSKMGYTCKVCHLRTMEACQGAEMESWKQYN